MFAVLLNVILKDLSRLSFLYLLAIIRHMNGQYCMHNMLYQGVCNLMLQNCDIINVQEGEAVHRSNSQKEMSGFGLSSKFNT